MPESRLYNSEYYDAFTTQTNDIEFYKSLIDKGATVLELGCGTGRVSFELSEIASEIVAVDVAQVMLDQAKAQRSKENIEYIKADITDLKLGRQFDYLIAPFRVMQALETDVEVAGFLSSLKAHMNESSIASVNVFNPKFSAEEMATEWVQDGETDCGQAILENGDVVKFTDIRQRISPDSQVMYPELVYRRYREGEFLDEHRNPICMRYWYPQQFLDLLSHNGFEIVDTWGGYDGQIYGEGPELVVSIRLRSSV